MEGMVDDLRDFRECNEQLVGWLAQKEKMVTVLGPMATEPAMVNNQLQQVQVSDAIPVRFLEDFLNWLLKK